MDAAEWAGAMECAAAGEWEAAAARFMRAPRSARTLHNAGVCYARLGDDDGALLALADATRADAYLAIAHLHMAAIYAGRGEACALHAAERCQLAIDAMRSAPHIDYGPLRLVPPQIVYAADARYALASCLSLVPGQRGLLSALVAAQAAPGSLPRHGAQVCRALCAPAGTVLRGGDLEPAWPGLSLFAPRAGRPSADYGNAVSVRSAGSDSCGRVPSLLGSWASPRLEQGERLFDLGGLVGALEDEALAGVDSGYGTGHRSVGAADRRIAHLPFPSAASSYGPSVNASSIATASTGNTAGSRDRIVVKLVGPLTVDTGPRLIALSTDAAYSLQATIAAVAAKLRAQRPIRLAAVDADGDCVLLVDDGDLADALRTQRPCLVCSSVPVHYEWR